jgi:hypothetical protein
MSFPSTWTKRVKITVPAAQVGSGGVSNFTVLLTEASLPASIFTDARSDGGDIRASLARSGKESVGLLGVDLIAWDAGAETALIRVGPMTLSSASANEFWIWYGNAGATLPAAGDDYGQYDTYHSTWSGYWPLGGGADRTSNQKTAAAGGSGPASIGGATGKVGAGTTYDGTNDYCAGTPALPTQYSTLLWVNQAVESANSTNGIFATFAELPGSATQDRGIGWFAAGNTFTAYQFDGGVKTAFGGSAVSASGSFTHVAGTYDGTNLLCYSNNSVGPTVAAGNPYNSYTTPEFIIGRNGSAYVNGVICEVQLHSTARNAAWITTEYNSTNAPGTFATAGTPETVGGIAVIMNHLKQQGIS